MMSLKVACCLVFTILCLLQPAYGQSDPCEGTPCLLEGSCSANGNDCQCDQAKGYFGLATGVCIHPCEQRSCFATTATSKCSNDGINCVCDNGFGFIDDDACQGACDGLPCLQEGTCYPDGDECKCDISRGYYRIAPGYCMHPCQGTSCFSATAASTCSNNGMDCVCNNGLGLIDDNECQGLGPVAAALPGENNVIGQILGTGSQTTPGTISGRKVVIIVGSVVGAVVLVAVYMCICCAIRPKTRRSGSTGQGSAGQMSARRYPAARMAAGQPMTQPMTQPTQQAPPMRLVSRFNATPYNAPQPKMLMPGISWTPL